MKKIFILLILYTNCFFGQYTLIPDPVFEQNLINQQIDSDGIINGQVLNSDIASITQLNLSSTNGGNNSIYSLQGIEGFSALETLSVFGNESLQFVNISNLNIKELYFFGNLIENIIVNASQLEILEIENPVPTLQTLDVTNCPLLKNLYCPNNSLTVLNISNNLELKFLTVDNNLLSQLIMGSNQKLLRLVCWNNLLTTLDLTNNPQLTHLFAGTNNLTSLNVSQNILLQALGCESNNLVAINLLQNTGLNSLSCSNNNITSLNLQNNPQLEYLLCENNNLSELNVQNGNNTLLNGTYTVGGTAFPRFNATNNPNLNCILVNDVANCQANWVTIDPTSNFVSSQLACDNLLSNKSFSDNELEVYPNPVLDILNIKNHSFEFVDIAIYNLLGEKILTKKTNNNQIDVSQLSSGVYMVLITSDNKTRSTKIMKN